MSASEIAESLSQKVAVLDPREAAALLAAQPAEIVARALQRVAHATAINILASLPSAQREPVLAAASPETAAHWRLNLTYPADAVGRTMDPPRAVFSPDTTVHQTTERLREIVKQAFITYGYVVDEQGKLLGVVVMRELLFAEPDAPLSRIMLRNPFSLSPHTTQMVAMKAVLAKHFPVYPVCEEDGRLVGLMRGSTLFEQQAVELTAQAGRMVGVDKKERLATPLRRSLRFRQPWLQLNLLAVFAAASVVGFFQDTVDRLVILAAFLPVLAGQSSNTGSQALAVSVRALTLGEFHPGELRRVLRKEALLGLYNGCLVGVSAAAVMYLYAASQGHAAAFTLAIVVFVAMVLGCLVSGTIGVVVPSTLIRLGFDPAAASSIFLTTVSDVVSMGLLLGLATVLVL